MRMTQRPWAGRFAAGLLVVASLLTRAVAAEPSPAPPLHRLVGQRVVHGSLVDVRSGRETRLLDGGAPGDMPSVLPAGTAKKIAAGSQLVFQLHYTPNGAPATDRSMIGLIVAREQPAREARTIGIANEEFTIPPGAAAHPVRAERRFDHAVRLLSLTPRMLAAGSALVCEATFDNSVGHTTLSRSSRGNLMEHSPPPH
jgi:hypothetical protein